MNRRNFFKTSGIGLASVAVFPTISALSTEPTKPIIHKKDKEYWKQHFRDTTQEHAYRMGDFELMKKRYTEDTYVQMESYHTDLQIDKLPNKSGPYMIYRLQYKHNRKDHMPTTEIKLVSTPILLEV